jgi:hypothetical protein
MRPFDDIDELHGDPGLRAFVEDVRAYASGPPPVVKGDLAAILTGGIGAGAAQHDPVEARPSSVDNPLRNLRDRLQGQRARWALGVSVLSLTVLGTGGAGALPGPAQTIFERTVEVVGIELPDGAGEAEPPAPSEPVPVPVEPEDGDGPDDGRETPRPKDERVPGPPPGDDSGGPVPSNPPPGNDPDREARERGPDNLPGPVSPPRPGPPESLPGGPPEGVPGGGRGQADGNQVGRDRIDQRKAEGETGFGRGAALAPRGLHS